MAAPRGQEHGLVLEDLYGSTSGQEHGLVLEDLYGSTSGARAWTGFRRSIWQYLRGKSMDRF